MKVQLILLLATIVINELDSDPDAAWKEKWTDCLLTYL